MGIEKVLENLEELFSRWGVASCDWVFTAEYALKLLGYDVLVREGHLTIQVNKTKIPWKIGEALETHPSVNTKFSKEYLRFQEKTGFEFDMAPVSSEDFKRKAKYTVLYTLPNGRQIRVQTPEGGLEELEIILASCTDEGWGAEKGFRIMACVEDELKALLKKGEIKLAKKYEMLIKKYSRFRKAKKLNVSKDFTKIREFTGIVASKGKVKGIANVILNPEITKKFEKGEILVTTMTSPKFTIFYKKTSAIVTDGGGALCHAAIVAREMKIPCIVGTKIATKVLKDGDYVEFDAITGTVRKTEK
ncbi:MAG TPA: PEP-utilizing enzyme [Candidatus Bathyarchaeia archaeon]|nr:PEP-utilizing enzyme [Candidatus Bathyarchaeia archaeon]